MAHEYSARMQTRDDLVATVNPRLPKVSASVRSGVGQNKASHASPAAMNSDFAVSVRLPGSFNFIFLKSFSNVRSRALNCGWNTGVMNVISDANTGNSKRR